MYRTQFNTKCGTEDTMSRKNRHTELSLKYY